MLKLSTSELSHSPWQVKRRHGSNHIQTKVSTLGKKWRKKFIVRFFPSFRFISAKSTIASLLRRCPNHSFDIVAQLHIFYSGLRPQTKMILDASTGGTLMSKIPEEAIVIIDSIATNDYHSHHDWALVQRKGIMELDT